MPQHEVLDSQVPYQGGFFSVVVDTIRLPGGRVTKREYIRHPGAAAVVAIEDGSVLLVRQNRHAVGEDLLEIPAGKLDVPGESPVDCARRELTEETGYEAGSLAPLGAFWTSPGLTDERCHLFLATGLVPEGPVPDHDDGEPITIEWLPVSDAVAVIGTRIVDMKTALGIALLQASPDP